MTDEDAFAAKVAALVVEKLTPQLTALVNALVFERRVPDVLSPPLKTEDKRWKRWWDARFAAGERRIVEVKAPDGTPGRKKYRALLDCGHERLLALGAVDDGEGGPMPKRAEDTVGMIMTCERCLRTYDAKHREPPRRT